MHTDGTKQQNKGTHGEILKENKKQFSQNDLDIN